MPVGRALTRQGDVRDVQDDVAAHAGAIIFDPWPILCPDEVCSTNHPDGYPRYYRDGAHVSVRQGEALTPDFVHLLAGDSTS